MANIIIKDSSGTTQASFTADPTQSVGTQAQEEGAPIPFSCGVGACRTCVAKVESGMEYVDPEAVGPMHIEVEEDEVLTCVCGYKEDSPDDAEVSFVVENL